MLCPRCSDKKGGRCSPVQVEHDVVISLADLACCLETLGRCLSGRDDVINRVVSVEQLRDPIFKQDVDLGVRKKSFEGDERGGGKNSVADRAKPNNENAPDLLPIDLFLVFGFWSLVFGHDSFSFPNLLTTDN